MKRFALLAAVLITGSAAFADAQVIGTYRPSVVTYYPSTTSAAPAIAYRPLPAATQYATASYGYPSRVATTQTVGTTPVVNASYTANSSYTTPTYTTPTSYTANTAYVSGGPYVAASPVAGGNCGCAPIQTIASTNYYPTTACTPVQTVAYQQPVATAVQPAAAQNTYIDGRYYVGKGLLGRPKVYAQGQPVRNALRAILP